MARWVSPVPRSTVWWVSSSRSTTRAGSSSCRRCSALASLSSSACVLATTAVASTGGGCSIGSTCTGWPFGASVSPVTVPASLATPPMSPAASASTGSCSLPRTTNRPCSRSSVPVRLFTRWSSLRIVPESTLSSDTWPTNGSAIVLNTIASGWPSGSAGTSTSVSPARTVVGRSAGGGPISTRRSASRSMPTSAVAEPHTTGKTLAVSMPRVRACSSSSSAGHVALEVALEQGVVGDDDALDEVVVHLVLERLHVVGDRLGVRDAALVEVGGVGEEVGDAAEVGLGADRQLERRDAGAEPVAELVERALEAGALAVELVDEDHPRHAEPGGLAPDRLGLHLDAVDRAHHEHGQVDDPQRGPHVAEEVGVAGRVDQVDLVALPLERRHRERERDARGAAPRGRGR